MDKFRPRPVIYLLLALIVGILSGSAFPDHRILTGFVILICVSFIVRWLIQKKPAFLWLVLFCFAWGYFSVQPFASPRFPPNHVINFTDKYKWLIIGVIDEKPIKSENRLKFNLEVETLGSNRTPVTGKIRVSTSGNVPELSRGDKISFVAMVKSIRNFGNPGGFDYERYMAFKRVWATAYVHESYGIDILEKGPEKGRLEDFRGKISALIDETKPGKHIGILKAMIIGDKGEISQSLREDFSRAGIAHLLAISGLHIGIIAGLAFIFFQWLLSYFQFSFWDGWPIKGAAFFSLFPILAYGFLADMSASGATQRAVIMTVVYLVAILIENKHDPINTLGIAAMVILIADTPSLFSVSFQLSFSAVLSIIYGQSKIPKDCRGGKLFSAFLVSLFTIIGTLPFIMLYYQNVTLVGLFANFVFVPVIGFVVIPLGLLSVLLYLFSAQAASVCIHISAFVLKNTLEIVTPTYFEIFAFYILAWAILNRISIRPEASDEKNRFARKRATSIAAILIFVFIGDAYYWLNQRFWHDDLRVTVIDVGQGSSALVETPGGECFLFDGGGFPEGSVFDVGERILAPLLLKKRIKTIDTIVLSHSDSDHLNGLLYIVDHFNVRSVWKNNNECDETNYFRFLELIQENGIYTPEFKDIIGEHEIKRGCAVVLYPPEDFIEKQEKEPWRKKPNNTSVVVKVTFESVSFLFPGDIEAEAEQELVEMAGDKLKSTVLVAPHHGSKTSSTDAFLDAVNPEYVIVSAGWNNRFHLPHPSVIKKYEERGYQIFRTDESGAISVSTDGERVVIEPYYQKVENLPDSPL